MKIIEILNEANLILDKLNIEDSNLKVKILLSDILNVKKEYLSINITEEVSEENVKTFFDKLELVKRNIPIQYIIGKQYFYGGGDRTRTGTHISARDFKSRVATVTPLPHMIER